MKKSDGVGTFAMPASDLATMKASFADGFIDMQDTGESAQGGYKDDFDEVEKAERCSQEGQGVFCRGRWRLVGQRGAGHNPPQREAPPAQATPDH